MNRTRIGAAWRAVVSCLTVAYLLAASGIAAPDPALSASAASFLRNHDPKSRPDGNCGCVLDGSDSCCCAVEDGALAARLTEAPCLLPLPCKQTGSPVGFGTALDAALLSLPYCFQPALPDIEPLGGTSGSPPGATAYGLLKVPIRI